MSPPRPHFLVHFLKTKTLPVSRFAFESLPKTSFFPSRQICEYKLLVVVGFLYLFFTGNISQLPLIAAIFLLSYAKIDTEFGDILNELLLLITSTFIGKIVLIGI